MTSEALAAGILAVTLGFGASLGCAQRHPEAFFKNKIGLSDKDIQTMDQGRVEYSVIAPIVLGHPKFWPESIGRNPAEIYWLG